MPEVFLFHLNLKEICCSTFSGRASDTDGLKGYRGIETIVSHQILAKKCPIRCWLNCLLVWSEVQKKYAVNCSLEELQRHKPLQRLLEPSHLWLCSITFSPPPHILVHRCWWMSWKRRHCIGSILALQSSFIQQKNVSKCLLRG